MTTGEQECLKEADFLKLAGLFLIRCETVQTEFFSILFLFWSQRFGSVVKLALLGVSAYFLRLCSAAPKRAVKGNLVFSGDPRAHPFCC